MDIDQVLMFVNLERKYTKKFLRGLISEKEYRFLLRKLLIKLEKLGKNNVS